MSSYKDLQNQIAELQKQAEQARKQEIASVVAEIKAKMAEYGISIEDLGMSRGRARKAGATSKGIARYRNPDTGQTWTGKGRKPQWMLDALAQGKQMDEFQV